MKCVKMSSGEIRRMSNKQADAAVKNGEAAFCSKKEWKEQGRFVPSKPEGGK